MAPRRRWTKEEDDRLDVYRSPEEIDRDRSDEPGCLIIGVGLVVTFGLMWANPDRAALIFLVGWGVILVVLHLVVDHRRRSDDGR